MSFSGVFQFVLLLICLLLLVKPLGLYISKVFTGESTWLDPVLCPIENTIYKITGIRAHEEQSWRRYAFCLFLFSALGFLLLFIILLTQQKLILNPAHVANMSFTLALNTAISFIANTNWQAYAGETGLSYFSQMFGLAVQNFLSAAISLCVAIALIRAFARSRATTIGNFWHDLTRSILWILLPLSIVLAIIYIWQGVPQNFHPYVTVHSIQGMQQIIPQGPVASQEAIKSLGTNGGGFFNANSAHPYENPTPITNFLQLFSIFAIAGALTYTFGRMVNDQKQGWMIFSVMLLLFAVGFVIMFTAELHGVMQINNLPIQDHFWHGSAIANFEGKETRFGIGGSVLYDQVATSASDGGVNSMLESYTPIGGAIALINMALGEIIIGGIGSGLYNMLLFVLLSVFIGGLMVGRTPEFLGKRVEGKEMKMVMLALLVSPLCILFFTALACVTQPNLLGISKPEGFTEILYAYTSAAMNNGSAFAGLNANSIYYNLTLAIVILAGRFLTILPVLVLAGFVVQKQRKSMTKGTLPTANGVFAVLLICVILIMAGLIIFPALALGPIAQGLA